MWATKEKTKKEGWMDGRMNGYMCGWISVLLSSIRCSLRSSSTTMGKCTKSRVTIGPFVRSFLDSKVSGDLTGRPSV